MDYIKRVENGGKTGYKDGLWFPHLSPEGGNDTIGYGHKLLNEDSWMKGGVSDAAIEKILFEDIISASKGAGEVINEYASGDFENISQRSKEMFTDFVFNLAYFFPFRPWGNRSMQFWHGE